MSFKLQNKTIYEEDILTTLDWFQLFCFVYNLQLHEMSYSWTIEKGLARARRAIKEAARSRSYRSNTKDEFVPRGSIYINPYAFHQLRFSTYFIHLMISLCRWLVTWNSLPPLITWLLSCCVMYKNYQISPSSFFTIKFFFFYKLFFTIIKMLHYDKTNHFHIKVVDSQKLLGKLWKRL